MSIYQGLNPIIIGSRKYGVFDENADYDYVVLIDESKVQKFLDAWRSYVGNPEFSISIDDIKDKSCHRYRVNGRAPTHAHRIKDVPDDATYDLTVVPKPNGMPDTTFIQMNWKIGRMIHITDVDEKHHAELVSRLTMVKRWAKENGVYGGAFPDGISYFIFTMATITCGYKQAEIWKVIHEKSMYYHKDYKFSHIDYVSSRQFAHMRSIVSKSVPTYTYEYEICADVSSPARWGSLLRSIKYLLDPLRPEIYAYVSNDGIIHSTHDIEDEINRWIDELKAYKHNVTYKRV